MLFWGCMTNFFNKFEHILKDIFAFVVFKYAGMVVNVLRSFFVASILGPTLFGLWSFSISIGNYLRYSNLGLSTFAYYRANLGRLNRQYQRYIFAAYYKITIPLAFILTVIFYYSIEESIEKNVYIFSLLFFLIVTISQYQSNIFTELKLLKKLKKFARAELFFALSSASLCILGSYFFSLVGVFIGYIASQLFSIYLAKLEIRPECLYRDISLNSFKFKTFAKNSIATISPSFINYVFINIDLWLLAVYFPFDQIGLFAIYLSFLNLVLAAPSTISLYIYSMYSKTIQSSFRKTIHITLVNFIITVIVGGAGYLVLKFIIVNWMDSYLQSIYIIGVLVWGIPFLSLKNILTNYFIANRVVLYSNVILFILIVIKSIFLLNTISFDYYLYIVLISNFIAGGVMPLIGIYLKKVGKV